MGGRSDPLHPPLRLSAVRKRRPRSGEIVRQYFVGTVRFPGHILAGCVEVSERTDCEYVAIATRVAVLRRGRLRSSLAFLRSQIIIVVYDKSKETILIVYREF